jgi:hypothetical protein
MGPGWWLRAFQQRIPALLAVAAVMSWIIPAGAQGEVPGPGSVALSWTRNRGAEHCPALQEIARRVDSLLGRPAFVEPSRARWLIEAAIEPSASNGWRVVIRLATSVDEPLGTRELEVNKSDCNAAANSAALAIAIMMAPDAELNEASAAFEVPAEVAARGERAPAPHDDARAPVKQAATPNAERAHDSPRVTSESEAAPARAGRFAEQSGASARAGARA